jgi:branched-chain amino acid transport system ATP-binding protein
LLELAHIDTFYGNLHILKDVSLLINHKEIVSLIGSNGAGKSTLLKTISGFIVPKSGKILYQGRRIDRLTIEEIVKRGIVIVMERRRLFAPMTVLENLEMGAYLRTEDRELRKTLEFVYGLFPILRERAKQIAGTLSGGEGQMLAIGRALMTTPQILLLDEPSLGLAPKVVEEIFSVIQNLNQDGTTILLVEQNANIALALAHRAYVIETGRLTLEGTGPSLLSNEHVKKAYLGM